MFHLWWCRWRHGGLDGELLLGGKYLFDDDGNILLFLYYDPDQENMVVDKDGKLISDGVYQYEYDVGVKRHSQFESLLN